MNKSFDLETSYFTHRWRLKKGRHISSLTYQNVVIQFLAGIFYCQIGIYNAKSMICISRPIRSQDNDRFCVLSKSCMSLNDKFFLPIQKRYFYDNLIDDYYTINTFQIIWHKFIIIILHLKDLF